MMSFAPYLSQSMALITLQEARQYLRIDDWYTEEDNLLVVFIDTATEYVLMRSGYNDERALDERKRTIAQQAVRLLVGHYWRTRAEAVDKAPQSIPHGVERLCQLIERFNV